MRIMEPLPPSSPSSAHEPIFEPLENSEEYQMQLLKISKFNDAAARSEIDRRIRGIELLLVQNRLKSLTYFHTLPIAFLKVLFSIPKSIRVSRS